MGKKIVSGNCAETAVYPRVKKVLDPYLTPVPK